MLTVVRGGGGTLSLAVVRALSLRPATVDGATRYFFCVSQTVACQDVRM